MINGFEEQTHELTDDEKNKIIPILERGFKRLVGKDDAMTSKDICDMIENIHGIKVTGPRLRKMVNYIRIHDRVPLLMATSKGYYVATDQQEVIDYIKSLRDRANAITAVADALAVQFNKQFT